jgi:tetratricopeptide (TPR) repeat protein
MKRLIGLFCIFLWALESQSQQTRFMLDPEGEFKQAKEYYQRGEYALAYPIFLQMRARLRESDKSNQPILYQEVIYYQLVCALKLGDKGAAEEAQELIDLSDHQSRIEQMYFHLAQFHFQQQSYLQALNLYEKCNPAQLSQEEILQMNFQQAYAYFSLKRYTEAKPLFEKVRNHSASKNQADAQYYYAFILFSEGKYAEALDGFKRIETDPAYADVVPFYIATILYNTGDQEKALTYMDEKLRASNVQHSAALHQLAGHAWFSKKNYEKALQHLESYAASGASLSRQDLYEISYCQYNVKAYPKAIEGFKRLTEGDDSLSQHAMYLLGDAYLKTGQKANARNAFQFCATNSANPTQKEISQFQYAKLSHELKFPDIAQSSLEQFLRDYPNSTYQKEARELLVAVLAGTSNYKDALVLLESIQQPSATVQQLMPRVYFGRACELMNDGLLVSADALFDKALASPQHASIAAPASFWKGEIAYRLNKTDDAQRWWLQYIEQHAGEQGLGDAQLMHARYNLGYAYFRKENFSLALKQFEQVVRQPKANSSAIEQDAWLRLADCHFMSRNFTKALEMYEQVIRFAWPAADYATFQKAMVAGVNNSSEKIKMLQSVERQFPNSGLQQEVNMEIANTYLSDEQFSKSIPYLQKAVNQGTNESVKPKALLKLGIAYYNIDQNDKALDQYKQVLTQYPNAQESEDALDNAKSIFLEEGKSSEYVRFARGIGRDISQATEDSLAYTEAELRFSNGDFQGAIAKFTDYLNRFPTGNHVVEAYYYRSEIYLNRKEWASAAQGYQEVANRVPNRFGERSLLLAARLNYFDLKKYETAATYYEKLKTFAATQENKLEGLRGLLRCQYQLQQWDSAAATAAVLMQEKTISNDDRALSNMALAKSAQTKNQSETAMAFYRAVVPLQKGAYAAEARYEIAAVLANAKRYKEAEKAAFETIQKSGSYEFWVVKAYLLLGDMYFEQKDYFNAKATYRSVLDNTQLIDLKSEAGAKLQRVLEAEKASNPVLKENEN